MNLPLTAAARRQLVGLVNHYDQLERPEAIRNLIAALGQASQRILAGGGLFFDAPRPYPALASFGLRWVKEGRYWIAYAVGEDGPVIHAVVHDAADIPNRL